MATSRFWVEERDGANTEQRRRVWKWIEERERSNKIEVLGFFSIAETRNGKVGPSLSKRDGRNFSWDSELGWDEKICPRAWLGWDGNLGSRRD